MKLRTMALVLISTLFIAGTGFAQNKKQNENDWKKIDSLINKGLTKSALEIVENIYAKAKKEVNTGQFVKAVIYRIKLQDKYQEESMVTAINDLRLETDSAVYPMKPILQSILADMYWRYYQGNRYKFMNRTETINFKQTDIRTWDLKKILEQTLKNYIASVSDEAKLKATPINLYEDFLVKQEANIPKFRPTLYDFLAHRAIDFCMSEEPGLTKPANKFELLSEDYFSNSKSFSEINITTLDTLSLKYYALTLLQKLTAFHLNDADPSALIDVNLKRLKFVKSASIIEYKDSLYLEALIKFEKLYLNFPASTDITYEIAEYYNTQGSTYNPFDVDSKKWLIKKAYSICEEAIKRFPNSDGAGNCKYLQDRITTPAIKFTCEGVNEPGKPFRSSLDYKNVPKAYIRIIKIDYDDYKNLINKYYSEDLMKHFMKLAVTQELSFDLPDDGDYQLHNLEIKMPALPPGYYLTLASNDKTFSYKEGSVSYFSFWMSNISYISRKTTKGGYDLYLFNRETGSPLKGAFAQSYSEKYNYITRDYDFVKGKSYSTNEEGFFHIPEIISTNYYSRYFYFDFNVGKDHLITGNEFYQYNYYPPTKNKTYKTYFFTDRAIYRPGQTVYFKGVMLSYLDEKNEIVPNMSTTVTFYDVNSQKISELNLVSNEYGTFSGTFTAPVAGLTGQMTITNTYGSTYISVEEYKRPKFEVTFNPIKGSYKLNENVKVTGKAKAYSGSNIDGAEVKYRVTRTVIYPYWYYWYRSYTPQKAAIEIGNGVTKTDENGEYTIDFKAIPDFSVNKKYKPSFNYIIYADVTDINGETHSSQKTVTVGYTALMASVTIPSDVNKDEKNDYEIKTTNLSGEKEPAKGTITIYKLKQPDKIFRERLWNRPDKFLLKKDEYYSSFPYDIYDDENNMYKWDKDGKVMETIFDTEKDSILKLTQLTAWKQGKYILELKTKDKYGEDVEAYSYFTVYSLKEKNIAENAIDWFTPIKIEGEPGEKASFAIGTRDSSVQVIYEVESKNTIVSKQWVTLNNELKTFEIPITEDFRGNFSIHLTFVKHGRCYNHSFVVTVPFTNKKLDFEFESFRNKLLPGQKEEWKIKIKGKNGEKVAAEMLASMYDASLNAFKANNWSFDIYSSLYSTLNWSTYNMFGANNSITYTTKYPNSYFHRKYYDYLNWFGFYYYGYNGYYEGGEYDDMAMDGDYRAFSEVTVADQVKTISKNGKGKDKSEKMPCASKSTLGIMGGNTGSYKEDEETNLPAGQGQSPLELLPTEKITGVTARSNFSETAFFFPQLQTDAEGNVIVSFTIPESLTKWKFTALAHTKDLKYGMIQKELVTQKDLMVVPNAPRFLREGDKITFSTKVSNVSDKDLSGQVQLLLFDAMTSLPVDDLFKNSNTLKTFEAKKGQSTSITWDIVIPDGIKAITYKVVAKAGSFSDGEEMALPILTNRMLVTETMPLPIRGNQTKEFTFTKLINSKSSTTLRNHKLTLEFSSNPAWYAVQALPYLMEYPYECSEQTFSRFYANSIASYIANSSPKIKAVFDSWKNFTPDALLSNLEKNQELKSLMLEETPWVMDAKNESERKKRIALLFDLNTMANELDRALYKLIKAQSPNGGFPWFKGMPDNRYITQYIVTGFGHLDHLGIKNIRENSKVWNMVSDAVKYLDNRIDDDYDYIKKWYPKTMDKNHLSNEQIQYLYARSYFKDIAVAAKNKEAFDYFKGQEKKYWLDFNRYSQGMIALALNRYEEKTTATDIMKSLKENSLHSEEMGMYWKDMVGGWYWYQAPIETQALLIEAFDEVSADQVSVEDLKVWLLKQKQTQDWKTTKATAEACYALLLRGSDWLASDQLVEITMGDVVIDPKKMDDVKIEAGTGYFKTSWSGGDIHPEMGKIKVSKKTEGVAWGAVYWQYFEQLDKITTAETPLVLKKRLFVQRNSPTGPVIEPITDNTSLKVGDKIKVRIELQVDRDMEYVHMKDMRASCFEPVNVISQYKYQDGLGYYESTKDASTNFFFNDLNKGTYVFEYALFVTNKGDFSNGITSIQCMYAPEFASHSEGIRVKVE